MSLCVNRRRTMLRVFRPVGQLARVRRELLCISDGFYFLVRFTPSSVANVPSDLRHFRLVLHNNFRLVGTSYGVAVGEFAYDDICLPHQVVKHDRSMRLSVAV